MKTWILHFWDRIRSGLWFVPSLFVAGAILLSKGFMWVDEKWKGDLAESFPSISQISADSIRDLMAVVATSMLSLAGITFSGTLVALSLASSQFGPRMLRNFLRSRMTQFTLAMLLSTFVYGLLVLRNVRDQNEAGSFVPHIAALAGFIGALVSIGAFILFVHHLATSLQADRLASRVFNELMDSIDRFFPDRQPTDREVSQADAESDDWEDLEEETAIESRSDGYLQALDVEGLLPIADRENIRMRVLKRPGHFLTVGTPLVALPSSANLDDESLENVHGCFVIGKERTPEQDFEYEILQLVEIALRALSPGINDPFTAMTCIDFLGAACSRIACRKLPLRIHHDESGVALIMTRPISFESILDSSFRQIRQNGGGRPSIAIRMLEAFEAIDRQCLTERQRDAVMKQARLVVAQARAADLNEADLEDIEDQFSKLGSGNDQPSEK